MNMTAGMHQMNELELKTCRGGFIFGPGRGAARKETAEDRGDTAACRDRQHACGQPAQACARGGR